MQKKAEKKQKNNPTPEEQVDQMHAIKALGDTQGGQELVTLLMQDVASGVYTLAYGDGSDRDRLCADLKANLNVVKLILNAEENEKILLAQIAEALSD